MHAVHTFLGAGVSYDIIDLNIKMMYVVRRKVALKFKSLEDLTRALEDLTRDRPTNGL